MAESNGLLDFLNTPAGMGLLSAVGSGLAGARRGGTMNAVGSGLLGGVHGYAQGQDLQRQSEYATQRGKLFDMQAQQFEQQQAAQRAEAERQAARQGYLGSVGQVTSPRLDAQPNQADPRQMLGMGFDPKFIETYMNAGNLGKAKIKDFKEIRNPDGSVSVVGFDEFGNVTNTKQTPFKAPDIRDFGGYVAGVDPITGKVSKIGDKTMTPGEITSNAVARGNLAVSQQRLALDKQGKPEYKDGQWVVPPRDMKPGESRPVTAPTAVKDATEALALIKQARQILPNATGSYGGWAMDQGARFFGASTPGAEASAKLKAIGGMLTSKMPKMSGPQSNADAALYAEMAGKVGDETLPIQTRMAALDEVEAIQLRHAGQSGGASGSFDAGDQGGWSIRPK